MFVAYFGGFKPPHKGHLAVVEEYLSMPDVETVFIVYGNKNRLSEDGSIVMNGDHTRAIWKLFISTLERPDRVKLVKTDGNTLVTAAQLAWLPEVKGSTITAGYGAKEPQYGMRFMNVINSLEKESGKSLATPVMVPTTTNFTSVSSTMIRKALSSNNTRYLEEVIPDGVSCGDYLNILK